MNTRLTKYIVTDIVLREHTRYVFIGNDKCIPINNSGLRVGDTFSHFEWECEDGTWTWSKKEAIASFDRASLYDDMYTKYMNWKP